ncbi:M23 family metallopeptidase [Kaistella daneshvariae]|uniref:M23 family metallopeptidase n=1 Tax=Kaistella daneshvariae TaxID=2487074 RepID=A0ABM7CB32_9FLAO|nr:M23 family metallopeptidase [Kaistella daneshvariae]AZI68234.1 M23 family metallopeptidase [Kaistella daneshvariae]
MKKLFTFYLLFCYFFLFSQQKWDVRFYNEIINREVFIYADNREVMPISAQFDFKLKNFTSSLENKSIVVIPAKTEKFLVAKLTTLKPNEANQFSYSTMFNFGNSLQENFDENHVYSLPFPTGESHLIFQGYNGKFSHQNTSALDFDLKTGDKVLAARAGIVVNVVDNNTKSCPEFRCVEFNNKITIMHSDGTFADYVHLKYNGALVKKGDLVNENELIGYSGNTGFSSGPHLHFGVFINHVDGSRTYIKTKFRTSERSAELLKEGKTYIKNY